MQRLKIKGTNDIPNVVLDADSNFFEISGRFLHDDVSGFFDQIFDWMDDYEKNPSDETIFSFKMKYFNTAASKGFLDILMRLEEIMENGNEVLIHWHFPEDDPDMEEAGIEYSEMVDVPFKIIPYKLD